MTFTHIKPLELLNQRVWYVGSVKGSSKWGVEGYTVTRGNQAESLELDQVLESWQTRSASSSLVWRFRRPVHSIDPYLTILKNRRAISG
jgi:hypothetical protein